jgi:hypothetical protein
MLVDVQLLMVRECYYIWEDIFLRMRKFEFLTLFCLLVLRYRKELEARTLSH